MRKWMIGTAVAALVAIPAFALMPGGHHGEMAPQTRASAEALVKEHFAQIDANKDGSVTREEFDASRAKQREARLDQRFASMDTNKDGQISRDEFNTAHKDRGEGMRGGGRHHGGKHEGGRMGRGGMFFAADANADGKVTLAEAQTKALQMFDRADANKDGTVTPEERKAAWQSMKGDKTKAP